MSSSAVRAMPYKSSEQAAEIQWLLDVAGTPNVIEAIAHTVFDVKLVEEADEEAGDVRLLLETKKDAQKKLKGQSLLVQFGIRRTRGWTLGVLRQGRSPDALEFLRQGPPTWWLAPVLSDLRADLHVRRPGSDEGAVRHNVMSYHVL